MTNNNTKYFWNKKLKREAPKISKSPIFVEKNKVVSRFLSGLTGNFLNIGIGYGLLEEILLVKKTALNFYGIDISSDAVNLAKKNLPGTFSEASILKIPFQNDFFDVVCVLDVLEHLNSNELVKSLSEIKRVIKKRGLLIVSVPLNEIKKDRFLNRHLQRFDVPSLLNLFDKHGFKIKRRKLLYAFSNSFYIKNFLARFLKRFRPNLIIATFQLE